MAKMPQIEDLLQQLDRIVAGDERKDRERRHEGGEPKRTRRAGRAHAARSTHRSGRPNSPWGRSRTTRAMTT